MNHTESTFAPLGNAGGRSDEHNVCLVEKAKAAE
jgi:hypothetical protein